MGRFLALLTCLLIALPAAASAGAVAYSITVTTAYAEGDPFPNRIDSAFVETATGYFQVANTGDTTFLGTVGTIAVSSFAGDLSFTSDPIVLAPGQSVSVAIPDNSEDVGGFNGPFYFDRPGVEITLNGTISNGPLSEALSLLVADANIHSGAPRTDEFGLTSDSFVLQGGDPWGFQTSDPFALSQADGVFVFTGTVPDVFIVTVPEPGSVSILATGLTVVAARLSGFRRRNRHRQ